MKVESLVIAHQHGAVNTFPGLVHTARHTTRVGDTRSRYPNLWGGGAEGMPGEGGEVVTRQPYRKVWLDHLLSKEHQTVCAGDRACDHECVTTLPGLLFSD
jgi:hypothetical protein